MPSPETISKRSFLALLHVPRFAVLLVLSACAAATQNSPSVSREVEPPSTWDSAIFFSIADSTTLPELPYEAWAEFSMRGELPRIVAGSHQFRGPDGELRSPWLSLPLNGAQERDITIRVVMKDQGGAQSTAEYTLTVQRDVLYEMHIGVGNRTQPHAPALLGVRSFPVQATAQRLPSDSLVIGYKTRTRN
jgi:hypothetical protein